MRTLLLTLHISGGVMGVLSGAVAMIFRKGFRWHNLAGKVFAIAMMTMAASGATLAVMKQQTGNVLGGTLTFYLVATAWMTARADDREKTGWRDWTVLSFALAAGLAEMILGTRVALHLATGQPGVPIAVYFIFGAIMLLAAGGDIRWMVKGGAYGAKRIVRHLWRMSFAFFIATGSFFLGQQRVFPAAWRGAAIWWVAAFLPLVLMVGWLMRVWITGRWQSVRSAKGPIQESAQTMVSLAAR
jgi:uncharacterized membrane protein